MTPTEAALVLAALVRAWPQSKPAKETMALYLKRLERFDAAAGWDAVDALIDHHKFFPSVAEMLTELRRAERRHHPEAIDRSDLPQLAAVPGDRLSTKDEAKAHIAQLGKQLAAWHERDAAALAPEPEPERVRVPPPPPTPRRRYDQTYFEQNGHRRADLWVPPSRPKKGR